MTTEAWQQRQHEATRALIQQGSQALRQNDLQLAQRALSEAAIILDMAFYEEHEGAKLRAQAFNELGVVHQRAGDLESSRGFHDQSAKMCDQLLEEGVVEFRGNSAATHLNLASVCATIGDMEAANAAAERSIEVVELMLEEAGAHIANLGTASYQTLASVRAHLNKVDEAGESMKRAIEIAQMGIDEGQTGLYANIAQGCQQLSVILFQNEEFDAAFTWGREAERLSETAFEEVGQDTLPIYIVSQINLISFSEQTGQFSAAEDSLWKAVELIGNDPRLLKRGKDFYEFCRKQADKRLNDGDLPRDEVESGYADLLERIEEIGGIPDDLEDPVYEGDDEPQAFLDAAGDESE